MEFIIFFLIWFFLCHLVGKVGENRNISYGGAFFLSFLLSPLIGLIFAAISDKKTSSDIDKYKVHYEKAKLEEFRGNIYEAIEEYKSTLYYLRTDNGPLSTSEKFLREEKFNEVKTRMEALGGSLSA